MTPKLLIWIAGGIAAAMTVLCVARALRGAYKLGYAEGELAAFRRFSRWQASRFPDEPEHDDDSNPSTH